MGAFRFSEKDGAFRRCTLADCWGLIGSHLETGWVQDNMPLAIRTKIRSEQWPRAKTNHPNRPKNQNLRSRRAPARPISRIRRAAKRASFGQKFAGPPCLYEARGPRKCARWLALESGERCVPSCNLRSDVSASFLLWAKIRCFSANLRRWRPLIAVVYCRTLKSNKSDLLTIKKWPRLGTIS